MSETVIGESGGTVACTTRACPLKVGAELVCAMPPAVATNSPMKRAKAKVKQWELRDVF